MAVIKDLSANYMKALGPLGPAESMLLKLRNNYYIVGDGDPTTLKLYVDRR